MSSAPPRPLTTLASAGHEPVGDPGALSSPGRERFSPPVWRTAVVVGVGSALGLLVGLVNLGLLLEVSRDPDSPWLALIILLDFILGLAAPVLLVWVHRRSSFGCALGCVALGGLSAFALPAALYSIAVVAAHHRPRRIATVAVVVAVSGLVGEFALRPLLTTNDPLWLLAVAALLLFAVPLLIGLNARSRHAAVVALANEAAAARREQAALASEAAAARREQDALLRQHAAQAREADARLAQARSDERTMIAREMHDSLSHELSLIAMHAGVLESRSDLTPEQHRATAVAIGTASRRAGSELRRVLTVLRDEAPSTEPPPDLAALDPLIAGLANPVSYTVVEPLTQVELRRLPPSVSRHLYRIARECLLNAERHAPGRPVRLALSGSVPDGVTIECRNPLGSRELHAPGTGFGLVGMQERARLAGGRCEAAEQDGEFVVTAWVPCRA